MSAILVAMIVLVPVPPASDEPLGVAPTLQFVKWNNGTLEQTVTVSEQVAVKSMETVNVNGRIVVRETVVLKAVSKTETRAIEARDAQVYDLDGKKVDAAIWQKSLAKGAIVLFADDGELPHPAFRKAIKDGTLIVVVKPQPK